MPVKTYSAPQCSMVSIAAGSEDAAWTQIRESTKHRLTSWGISLLRAGLDGYASTVLVEPVYICKDYRNLYSHFYSKKFLERSSLSSRLHFFDKPGLSIDEVVFESDALADHYLGYSVIEPVADRCIGRTVVDPWKVGCKPGEFFCLRTDSHVRVLGTRYSVRGFPYRSQSGEATVCAHTALWSACRYLSERYPTYRELQPYDLIEMTGDTNGRRVPYRGMTYEDYSRILSEFGCHPMIIRPIAPAPGAPLSWTRDSEAYYDLYSYVESGFPVLTSFNGHVVNLIGHTISTQLMPDHQKEKEVANRALYNSAAFVKEYVVVDDNFFPYQCLGYSGTSQYYPANAYSGMISEPSIDSIFAAVVPLPEKAYLQPRQARRLCYAILDRDPIPNWIQEALNEAGIGATDPLIARLFLTSASPFKGRKREFHQLAPSDTLLTLPIRLNLPHFVWVLELSALTLYNNRQCFAEMVMDATVGPGEWEPIYLRFGRRILIDGQTKVVDQAPPYFPQYSHNLGRI